MSRGIHSIRGRWAVLGAVTAVAVALAGCTASAAPAPKLTATPVAKTIETTTLAGKGPASLLALAPAGARSLAVRFVCAAGGYSITLGEGEGDSRSGRCGSVNEFSAALPKLFTGTVAVTLPKTSAFTLEITFSNEAVQADVAVTDQCTGLSEVQSTLFNAQEGHRLGKVSVAEWSNEVSAAAGTLASLPTTGLLGPQLALGAKVLKAAASTPITLLGAHGAYADLSSIAAQVCEDNGTPVTVSAAYGG